MLADVRPLDIWDSGDFLGAVLLLALSVAIVLAIRVIRRR
jgi:hypothetical protein